MINISYVQRIDGKNVSAHVENVLDDDSRLNVEIADILHSIRPDGEFVYDEIILSGKRTTTTYRRSPSDRSES